MRLVPLRPQSAVISRARVCGMYCTVTSAFGHSLDRQPPCSARTHIGTRKFHSLIFMF
jgi:hypothetical protein